MSSGGLRREVHKQSTHTVQTTNAGGHLVSPKSTNNHAANFNQGYDHNEPRHLQSKSNHGSSYKPKSISAGRSGQGQPSSSHHQNQQHIQPGNNITPLLQSAQSMSSLSKPFNGNGGRVLISPTNFTTVRGTTNNGHHAQQQQQTQQQQHSGHNLGASQTVAVQQRDGGAAAASRRHQQHGSLGKLNSHKTLTAGSSEPQQLIDSHTQQQMVQMRADQNQQNSQSYLKQLRKSQISALRQLKKPAGEQHLQPGVVNKVERMGSTGVSTGLVKTSSSKLQPQGNVGTPSYPKLSLSDRHGANQQKLGSQDQLLSAQNQNASNQQAQQTQLESEYGSLGRQDQKIRFYQSRDAHHPMSRQAAAGNGVVLSNKGSDENSDDFQAVAEEDMGSFILHRNAYLEGDIITAESQLFKQQPKQGRDPRPNPNSHSGKSQQVQATQSSQGLAYQRGYSSQKQLITGSVASQLSHHSGGRLSSQNTQTPMQVEEIVSAPTSIVHGSEAKQRRHGSNSGLGGAATTLGGSKSNRKTIAGQTVQMPSLKPQINTLAGPSDYQPVRALTTLAGPVQTQSFGGQQNDLISASHQSNSEQKRRASNNKGLQRVEAMTSMGVTKPQYPMFPLEDNKKAMIQFEMNLLARVNKQAAAASYSHTDSNQHGTNTLLNKATLCDSTNSKQNSQNSAFLRKSLWLLTSMKNKALKEAVQTQQANCQACHYLRKQGVGCFAQNQAIQSPSIHHAQTFIYNQNDSHGNAGIGLGGPIGRGNLAQSVVVTLPPDKQGSSSTQDSNIYKSSANQGVLTVTKKDGNSSLISRQQQIQKRHTQKRANIKQTSQTGIIDKTQGGISSQGVNWLGSMGTQILLVESYEHDFWKLLTQKTLNTKYLTSQEYYNSKIAADIMYNEQRHIVSVFKEYLIFDDFSEYLKRFYSFKEAQDRLPRVFEFYEHYSKVFPNYVSVPESKYMFKNIERKQKLIDQRHQVFIKNQAKEGKDMDGKAAAYKHSANMLFGSQFLKEVYADEDKSMSRVSFEIRAAEKERILNEKFSLTVQSKQPKPQQTLFQSPGFDQKKMKLMAHNTDFISPQAKQAQAARNISRKGQTTSVDASNVKHQNELENVISMLSKFEQSRRGEESQSISISRSYVEGATGMGANPKQTPSRVAALQSDASRKNLKHKIIKKHDKHMASHQNLDELKKSHRAGELFTDGWNFAEPVHDLSMSSWALTSFVKNGEEQPSGVAGLGSIVDTGSVGPFQAEDLSIDDFSKIVLDSSKRPNKRAEIKKNSVEENMKTTQKRLQPYSDAIGPQSGIKIMRASETQLNHLSPSGPGTTTSKHARRAIENRRNSAISPKAGDSSKALQSVALVQKSALEQKSTGTQIMKTSRHEREKIKQTPQREEKQSVKKKATVVSKTGQNNLANSRCRSKLSIGSSQTQTQQTMTKKAVQTHNKKQIEKMIKDSSLKLQLDKNNRHHLVTVQKRTGLGSTTNVLMKGQMSIGQNLATLAAQNEPIHAGSGQIYNTSQHSVNPKSQKSNQNTQAAINSSRNAKQSSTNGGIKSNSQLASAAVAAGSIETSSAYKSSGHIPSVVIQGSKVFKATGYEDSKGINERFIDLNKASEGAPKISKPTINTVLKSNDFSQMKGSTQGIRLGDQSAKNPSNSNQGLLASVSTQQQINSVRTGQSSLGFRKGSETQSIMVVNQQISPMNSGGANKLQNQVKTVQRTYHNRPMNKPEHIHGSEISNQGHALANQKSPAAKMQSSSNLPQIFKKEQKEGKTIRPSHYDVQLKTIFKHDTPSSNQYTSVPAQQSNLMYTTKNKKQSPEQTSIHFNTQHVASKSHEPKERQKSEPININNAQSAANSVIGHNSQHGLMLLSMNNGHQMMNQASSSVGPQSTTNARKEHHGKMDGNMLIQNNILQKNSGHLQSQLGSSTKASNNPYSKTGRILNSLNNQKQSVQSLGHMSGTSASGSHHIKGGRNAKLNVKATGNNHALKGTTAQSVSSSSSIGSSKISLNSHHGKSDSSQIYLKTLSRGHAQNHMQTGMGTKSTMVIRKTPSGSNSSSKTKKIKVTSTNSGSATVTKTKLKSTTTATKNTAQNPYPAGAAHGQTIFSVTVPRQSLQQTINSGVQQVNSNRLNNHHHA